MRDKLYRLRNTILTISPADLDFFIGGNEYENAKKELKKSIIIFVIFNISFIIFYAILLFIQLLIFKIFWGY